ncbi:MULTISPECIES: M23 family metallopeptidase [unclassified Streptomyces]|uniref:M23 family metallopeptidase n=1 Tax=unclassified Streptomyces TaxID=2593676 RepID=UPI0004BF1028|nr:MULTISPECIES: M23 family metallopeptidase [unclassified Streptomyces]
MSQRATSRSSRTSQLRTRATVLAAGLGVSVALGAGVASAADTTPASGAASAVQAQGVAEKAAKKAKPTWVDPVKKYKLSASFAQNGGMWQSTHSGQDFAVPSGTKVVAAHGGTVVKAGGNGAGDGPAYGNAVVIKHGSGTYSQYAHLSKVEVRVGQVVKTGQEIARSGNTGNSSGPHLHFEIRTTPNYGSAIDPVKFLQAKGVKV